MWKDKDKKGELDKELEKKSIGAWIGALFGLNPGSISYLLSKRKLRNQARKMGKYPRYREYERIEKIR
ncbi:MAG: hypothetical protein ACFFC6_15920 [Promethearchaeota archaeon]